MCAEKKRQRGEGVHASAAMVVSVEVCKSQLAYEPSKDSQKGINHSHFDLLAEGPALVTNVFKQQGQTGDHTAATKLVDARQKYKCVSSSTLSPTP